MDAIKAGAAVLMTPGDLDAVFRAILSAVRSGEISEARIDESVRKILALKASLGLNEQRYVDRYKMVEFFKQPEAKEFAQQVSDVAITLVISDGQVLPLPLLATASAGAAPATVHSANERLVLVSFSDSESSPLGDGWKKT